MCHIYPAWSSDSQSCGLIYKKFPIIVSANITAVSILLLSSRVIIYVYFMSLLLLLQFLPLSHSSWVILIYLFLCISPDFKMHFYHLFVQLHAWAKCMALVSPPVVDSYRQLIMFSSLLGCLYISFAQRLDYRSLSWWDYYLPLIESVV